MKKQNIIIATLVALVALLSTALVYAAVDDHRRSKYYKLIRNQGYDAFEEVDSAEIVEVDTVVWDTTEIDTIESIEYVLDDDTYERAKMARNLLDVLHYHVERVDTDYNSIVFNFRHVDEHMRLIAKDKTPGLIVEDNAWDSFSVDNNLARVAMWMTINKFNEHFPFKILYYQDDDVIRIYTSRQVLMDKHESIHPDMLRAIIDNMVRVKSHFHEAMVETMEELLANEE